MTGANYTELYCFVNIVCYLVALGVCLQGVRGVLGVKRRWLLSFTMVVLVILCGYDIMNVLRAADTFTMPLTVTVLVEGVVAGGCCILSGFWLLLVLSIFRRDLFDKQKVSGSITIFVLVVALICILTPETGWVFSYGKGMVRIPGPLMMPVVGVNIFMVIMSLFFALDAFKAANNSAERKFAAVMTVDCALIWMGFAMQSAVPDIPILALVFLAVSVSLAITSQEKRINADALTGLNNRRRADVYTSGLIEGVSEDGPFWFTLVDIDQFKKLNDEHGHLDCDEALDVLADALRKTAGDTKSFVARWGGDEFVFVSRTADDELPKTLGAKLQENVAAKMEASDLSFALTVSLASVLCDTEETTVENLLNAANKQLHEQASAAN